MITLNPTSDSNKSRRISSSQNGGRVRDVSFSSFLDGTEETFILKLAESEDNLKSHKPNCLDENHNYLASKKAEDNTEIDVFNAEKYFNGRVEDADESHGSFDSKKAIDQKTNINPRELELYKSSLNSRSSLLLDGIPQTQQSRKSYRWSSIKCRKIFFSKLGCSCNDKNSVAVDMDVQVQVARISSSSCSGRRPAAKAEDFPMKIELQKKVGGDPRIEDFRFPVMKSNRGGEEEDDDGARKSLKVFGNMSGLSVERRLKMLTWDDGIDIEIPSKSSRLYYNNNVDSDDSDASSDLFEIESLSTNPSSSQYLTGQTSDAPSIDWSVVTAADVAVMSSDSEERMRLNSKDCGTNGGGGKTRRHSSILSGCYNNKAVMVAGDAHRTTTGDQQVSGHSREM